MTRQERLQVLLHADRTDPGATATDNVDGDLTSKGEDPDSQDLPGGTETVLLVEDEESVREGIRIMADVIRGL